jgi:hypothetical protein
MKTRFDLARASNHSADEVQGLEEEVANILKRSFGSIIARQLHAPVSCAARNDIDDEEVARRIASILLGFARNSTTPENRAADTEGIRVQAVEFVRRRVPVEAQMLWSPKKHWVIGTEGALDLAELAAMQTLVSVADAVRSVYAPGLRFVLDVEDIEFEFMETQSQEVIVAREIYIGGLKRLIIALGLDEHFTVRQVSQRAKSAEELERWRRQMTENYQALETYWLDSENSAAKSWPELPSFNALCQLGWKGTIPPEMRSYYLNRLGKLAGTSVPQKIDLILRNLAGILFHHQIGLLDGFGQFEPVKFSFVRAADGAPDELRRRRIDLRFAPRKLCSRVNAAAPWATKGFICGRGDRMKVAFRGWHELANERYEFSEGRFLIGRDKVAEVRADYARTNASSS